MKALELKEVSYSYDGKHAIIDQISFGVDCGEVVSLMGLNGAGKTTLLELIATLKKPAKGQCLYFDDETIPIPQIRSQIGYVAQEVALYDHFSIEENLHLFGKLYHLQKEALEEQIQKLLKWLKLEGQGNVKIKHCSGGMKRKAHLAAALLHQPKLLILDEPTAGIDAPTAMQIIESLRGLSKEGVAILCVAHSFEEVLALGGRVIWLKNGRKHQEVNLDDVSINGKEQIKTMFADCI
ncbi:ABC-2 type transport system ATP-binding protein [Tindallia magadiensis]|uniref:ABC-2 type transport system ATP-binding protein n=1 Tax=Tindallia magadiensis TaxID=69895 RepID=A0A1I3EJY2_9FIRM|nr:ABC transporter ATP-binding protein [Tindallia magadiensis]SFH99286.1 ABC-2 type transport system ATP-binding protein [Tindallia magadiensis]